MSDAQQLPVTTPASAADSNEDGTRELAGQLEPAVESTASSFRLQTRVGILITYARLTAEPADVVAHLVRAVPAISDHRWLCEAAREHHQDGTAHIHAIILLPRASGLQLRADRRALAYPGHAAINIRIIRPGIGSRERVREYIRKESVPVGVNQDIDTNDTSNGRNQSGGRKRLRDELDGHFQAAFELEDLAAADAYLQANCTTEWLRLRDQFHRRHREIHRDADAELGTAPLTALPVSGLPLSEWNLPIALQQWLDNRAATPQARHNLILWDESGGTGKSVWARTIGRFNHISGAASNEMFTRTAEVRIYDDLTPKGWETVFKNKRLHQPGETCGLRIGNYQREKIVLGSHSVFLMNYDPANVIRGEDQHYWSQQATWVHLTGPLFSATSASGEVVTEAELERDDEWWEHYTAECM